MYRRIAVISLLALTILTGCPNDTTSQPEPIALEVVPGSGKTIYSRGEPLDLSGLKVQIFYADGTSKEKEVLPAEVADFDSAYYNDELTLTINKDGFTVPYTVKVIGDLLGTWTDNDVPEFILRDDMTGDHRGAGRVRWSIKNNILEHYWEDHGLPMRYVWTATVIADELYTRDPIRRLSGSGSLAGQWECITWYDGSYAKLSINVDETGATVITRFENISFDTIDGIGTWDDTGTDFVSFTFSSLPSAGMGSTSILSVSDSTNEAIMPNGEHQVIWYDANHIGVDDTGFVKTDE